MNINYYKKIKKKIIFSQHKRKNISLITNAGQPADLRTNLRGRMD